MEPMGILIISHKRQPVALIRKPDRIDEGTAYETYLKMAGLEENPLDECEYANFEENYPNPFDAYANIPFFHWDLDLQPFSS